MNEIFLMNCTNSQTGRLFHRGGSGEELQIYRRDDEPFTSYEEVSRSLEQAEQRAVVLAERLPAVGIDPEQL